MMLTFLDNDLFDADRNVRNELFIVYEPHNLNKDEQKFLSLIW